MTDTKLIDDLRLVLSTTPRGRVSLEIGDDGHTIEREVLVYKVLEKAIATLEAKPEPAKPLPESADAWINSHAESVSDCSKTWWIKESDIRAYIASMHSQHQAELAAAREQGRREALQAVPVEALDRAARHCDSMMDYETGGIISDWVESARDAQEKP